MESEPEAESEMESELGVVSELEMENRVSPDNMDLTATERKNIRYKRIKKTGRTDPEPPLTAPFPFMVDRGWVASVWTGQHAEYVRTWASYANPPGYEGDGEFEIKEHLVDVEDEDNDDNDDDDEERGRGSGSD
ncbi:hypothetical protein JB92DRAFT_3120066 [Gautieria morchelliformis]|nr:hypothetical protein JB92DRAFT_3120066 [Gautieria morchelliformis]